MDTIAITTSMHALLLQILNDEKEWVKVHAAEYLLLSGLERQKIMEAFLHEENIYGDTFPYCVGIWRVLTQVDPDAQQKTKWLDLIAKAFLNGPARIHAAESLAKLGIAVSTINPQVSKAAESGDDRLLAVCTRWSNTFISEVPDDSSKNYFFDLAVATNESAGIRTLAAFILRQLGTISLQKWLHLSETAVSTSDPALKIALLTDVIILAPPGCIGSSTFNDCFGLLRDYLYFPLKSARIDSAAAMAEKGTTEDIAALLLLTQDKFPLEKDAENADVKAAAAYAVLRIKKRYDERQSAF